MKLKIDGDTEDGTLLASMSKILDQTNVDATMLDDPKK